MDKLVINYMFPGPAVIGDNINDQEAGKSAISNANISLIYSDNTFLDEKMNREDNNSALLTSTLSYSPIGSGEPDDASSCSDGSHLSESFQHQQEQQYSPRSPRLEDSLPEFVPPKRYVKPEEKKDTSSPGVMIMVRKVIEITLFIFKNV